ncbi:hypothetical protein CONLIGDRAFT_716416 [Coniochaeta ligniaria NRRL 30616]|uniref:Helix-turn-helix domain-containing protein n=1 Tax=Coniochaeta ligniaria NRRL 30616 TaxID=1408157 RepID=A0A1J7J436_9PEZI|nr:hypothetical protein CONLIGDRAFT_716416 [Coniochaeta ligniaria NRRL 30616]
MGSGSSKAAQAGARKFPTRAPGAAPPRPSSHPRPNPEPSRPATFSKDEATRADALNQETVPTEFMNPAFAARLKELGAVQPNPLFSNSSTAGPRGSGSGDPSTQYQSPPPPNWPSARDNATLGVLEARRRLEEQADAEMEHMGRTTDKGKELLDVGTIRRVLLLRQQGVGDKDIEERFGLRPGVVKRLGPPGVVEALQQLSA